MSHYPTDSQIPDKMEVEVARSGLMRQTIHSGMVKRLVILIGICLGGVGWPIQPSHSASEQNCPAKIVIKTLQGDAQSGYYNSVLQPRLQEALQRLLGNKVQVSTMMDFYEGLDKETDRQWEYEAKGKKGEITREEYFKESEQSAARLDQMGQEIGGEDFLVTGTMANLMDKVITINYRLVDSHRLASIAGAEVRIRLDNNTASEDIEEAMLRDIDAVAKKFAEAAARNFYCVQLEPTEIDIDYARGRQQDFPLEVNVTDLMGRPISGKVVEFINEHPCKQACTEPEFISLKNGKVSSTYRVRDAIQRDLIRARVNLAEDNEPSQYFADKTRVTTKSERLILFISGKSTMLMQEHGIRTSFEQAYQGTIDLELNPATRTISGEGTVRSSAPNVTVMSSSVRVQGNIAGQPVPYQVQGRLHENGVAVLKITVDNSGNSMQGQITATSDRETVTQNVNQALNNPVVTYEVELPWRPESMKVVEIDQDCAPGYNMQCHSSALHQLLDKNNLDPRNHPTGFQQTPPQPGYRNPMPNTQGIHHPGGDPVQPSGTAGIPPPMGAWGQPSPYAPYPTPSEIEDPVDYSDDTEGSYDYNVPELPRTPDDIWNIFQQILP